MIIRRETDIQRTIENKKVSWVSNAGGDKTAGDKDPLGNVLRSNKAVTSKESHFESKVSDDDVEQGI